MSKGSIACCVMCQTNFSNHDDFAVHSCKQIKVELNEFEDDRKIDICQKETFDVSESNSDYSPKEKKMKKSSVIKKKPKKEVKSEQSIVLESNKNVVRRKRKRTEIEIKEEANFSADQNQFDLNVSSYLELSEEFINSILQQVDELCENIKIGDPDIERTLEVNSNLNNAVSCYKNKLIDMKCDSQENDNLNELGSESDGDYDKEDFKKSKRKRMRGPGKNAENDKKAKLFENQCGKHSVNSMCLMLNTNKTTMKQRMKKEGNVFHEKQGDCYFCETKKRTDGISKDLLFPFLKFNNEKTSHMFQCSICKLRYHNRAELFVHIKSIHESEIKNKQSSHDIKPELKPDCVDRICTKMYGIFEGKKFWCTKCTEISQMPKEEKPKPENIEKSNCKLCPECGKICTDSSTLKRHLDNKHYGIKQICPHCAKDLPSESSLKDHINKVHLKIPCTQCGVLVGSSVMGRHIRSAHTPNDEKKFKCDICGKGFENSHAYQDHMNTHTGKKPYKCKYCSACFASKGNQRMHERGHEGYHRNK